MALAYPDYIRRSGKLIFVPLLAVVISVVFLWVIGCTRPHIHFVGIVLQLLGLGTAVVGADKTLKAFDKRGGISFRLKNAWEKRPRRRHTISADAHMAMEFLATAAGGSGANAVPLASTFDDLKIRLESLEGTVKNNHLEFVQFKLEQTAASQRTELEIEQTRSELRKEMAEAAIREMDLALVGVSLLFLGTVLSF